jgi:hypothetical protein
MTFRIPRACIAIAFTASLVPTSAKLFAAPDATTLPGCSEIAEVTALVGAYAATLEDEGAKTAAAEDVQQLREAQKALCLSSFTPGTTVRYANGQVATYAWGVASSVAYYPNGTVITPSLGQRGATWSYPNGNMITATMGETGATWRYPNGNMIAASLGYAGNTWNYPNGKPISATLGDPGATWYAPSGSTWTSTGPQLSKEALAQPGCLLTKILVDKALPKANTCAIPSRR